MINGSGLMNGTAGAANSCHNGGGDDASIYTNHENWRADRSIHGIWFSELQATQSNCYILTQFNGEAEIACYWHTRIRILQEDVMLLGILPFQCVARKV